MAMRRRFSVLYMIGCLLFATFMSFGMGLVCFASSGSVTVNKTEVQIGEMVTATFDVGWLDQEGGWIGLYEKNATDANYISYKKYSFNNKLLIDKVYEVVLEKPDEYEFRMFKDYYGTIKIAATSFSVVFAPTSSVTVQESASAEETWILAGEQIRAQYTISAADGSDTSGWVGFYKVGTDDEDSIVYQKTGGKSGSFIVTAPAGDGIYEFRLFKDYYGTYKLAASDSVTVSRREAKHGEDSKARFNTLTGEVMVLSPPDMTWHPATVRTVLKVGDRVRTGPYGSCILQLEDYSLFIMKQNSEIVIQSPPAQQTKLGLVAGNVWINTKKILTNGTMEIEMGQAVAGIKGTTLVCSQINGTSKVMVMDGVVKMTSSKDKSSVYLSSGETLTMNADGIGEVIPFDRLLEAAGWSELGAATGINTETVIVLQVGNPYLILNTIRKEIDPGLGTKPVVLNGRTLLPIRAVIESLGGSVDWIKDEQKVILTLGMTTMELWVSKNTARVNGRTMTLDVPPMIFNGRTLIPLRFVAENFGAGLEWDNVTKKAYIIYKQ